MAKSKDSSKEAAPAEAPEPHDKPADEAADTHEVSHELLEAKPSGKRANPFKRFLKNKKLSIPVTVLLIVAIIFAVPMSRYKVLGLFIQKNFSVTVLDAESGKPVTGASVTLASASATTDENGKVALKDVAPGNGTVKVTKKYYKDASQKVMVTLSDTKNKREVRLQPTGRQVPVTVTNKITGKVLGSVTIQALGTEAKTDDKGQATIVLPADQKTAEATLKFEGYNDTKVRLTVAEGTDKNAFTMTPSGKMYFLSKSSGKIDVVKTNLDGSERQIVVAGTGKELDRDTVLLATRDWKYLALKARREGTKAKLYLLDTTTDKLVVMDEGDADFELIGWQNHSFVFKVARNKKAWEAKRQAIKSYDADKKTLTTMRESAASGTSGNFIAEDFPRVLLTNDSVIYLTDWNWCCESSGLGNKQRQIVQGKVGTTQVTVLKGFLAAGSVVLQDAKVYKPNEIYIATYNNKTQKAEYYEYEDGKVVAAKLDEESFYSREYPRYIESPSGKATFWTESRDGKNTLFLGGKEGDNGVQLMAASEFTNYGWYTDSYVLVSKNDSELYIMSTDKNAKPVKITDYHKPAIDLRYYGGGY